MTKIDRSKFKATNVAATKQADKAFEQATGTGGERGPSADYHSIDVGMNYHRIYPPHPGDGGELYAVPKGVHWVPQEVPDRDKSGNIQKDKNGKVITKIADRPLFNARIHGNKSKDIVEEYIAFSQKIALESHPGEKEKDVKARKEFLDPIIGGFGSKYSGLTLRPTWVMYTDKLQPDIEGNILSKALGRLEIKKGVKNDLNSISAIESANEPLGTDPFTDLDEGRAISILYNDKATQAKDYYTTSLYAPIIKGSGGRVKLYPISDADLEKFELYPSLKKLFVNVYDRKAFDTALKGIKMFDEKYEIGVFAYEEFLDICDQLSSEFPEGEESEEEEGSGNVDEFGNMDRDELKAYIRENKLGIMVNKSLNDDTVRDLIREAISGEESEKDEEEQEETKVEESPTKKTIMAKTSSTKGEDKKDLPWEKEEKSEKEISSSTKDRLAAIRNKIKK